jgi:hypothetical protein
MPKAGEPVQGPVEPAKKMPAGKKTPPPQGKTPPPPTAGAEPPMGSGAAVSTPIPTPTPELNTPAIPDVPASGDRKDPF